YWGLYAVNVKTGEREWYTEMKGSLEAITGNSSLRLSVQQWLSAYNQGALTHHVLLENSVLGTLSTDLSRAYAVDDRRVPPHPNCVQNQNLGGGAVTVAGGRNELVQRSLLRAYDLDNGKLLWEAGGERGPQELRDSYFLGAPLPLGGKLYVLAEQNGELRLVCLDPPRDDRSPPTIVWTQTLATMQVKLAQ